MRSAVATGLTTIVTVDYTSRMVPDSTDTTMAKSKSNRRWIERHINDPYVKRAQVEGYRSRAAYKLLEIQDKDRVLRPGMRVLDLGAAPGGWSQVASRLVAPGGLVLALDILPMDAIPGVTVIEGDFREQGPFDAVIEALDGAPADVILSDMAPNISGNASIDQPRMMYLCELALECARRSLAPGGTLVTKIFQGEGFDVYLKELRACHTRVVSRKPKSSRPGSRELYLVAKGYAL